MGAASDKLDIIGLDAICESICDKKSMTQIAEDASVSIGSLLTWIEANSERSARVREARTVMARYWDERSEKILEEAADEFGLKKAKELSHHYRWRASKIAPREYGDKLMHTDSEGNNLPAPQFIVNPVAYKTE